jgi:medium-chain acyl-[acyl-carrier-protein] hydrolase
MPFAFFGHSMGAGIAFELSRRLRRLGGIEPTHLFVSGRRAPHMPDADRPLHRLPDAEFIDELRRLNGTPAEVLDHPELMEMMLPLLRADFSVSETYTCEPRPSLSCPLTVFGGTRDHHAGPGTLEGWREHTVGRFDLRMFEGDHFFINTEQTQVLRALDGALVTA